MSTTSLGWASSSPGSRLPISSSGTGPKPLNASGPGSSRPLTATRPDSGHRPPTRQGARHPQANRPVRLAVARGPRHHPTLQGLRAQDIAGRVIEITIELAGKSQRAQGTPASPTTGTPTDTDHPQRRRRTRARTHRRGDLRPPRTACHSTEVLEQTAEPPSRTPAGAGTPGRAHAFAEKLANPAKAQHAFDASSTGPRPAEQAPGYLNVADADPSSRRDRTPGGPQGQTRGQARADHTRSRVDPRAQPDRRASPAAEGHPQAPTPRQTTRPAQRKTPGRSGRVAVAHGHRRYRIYTTTNH